MSRKRSRGSTDVVHLNVGGEIFQTSKSTLTANSEFFSRKFSSDWSGSDEVDEEIFLDRDADSFRVLLSCMRHRAALLPEDKLLCSRVLLEAQYLGVDWLLEMVKSVAHTHLYPDSKATERHVAFDEATGGLDEAIRAGILPARFFGPAKVGIKRVKQLIPAGENDVVVGPEDGEDGDRFRVVSYALLEGSNGETSGIEPIVAMTDASVGESRFQLASDAWDDGDWQMSEVGVQYEFRKASCRLEVPDVYEEHIQDLNELGREGYYIKHADQDGNTVLMQRKATGF